MKPTLLIIEENETTVFGYTQFLSKTGYDVTVATTLKTADALLAVTRPDAILLDMKLSDGSGIEWLEKVRKRNPDTLVIMITAHGDVSTVIEAMQRGADHFFSKPVELEEIDGFLKKRFEFDKLRRKDVANRRIVQKSSPYFGSSPAMQKIFELASPAALSDTVVLLQGKTGTGKGVIARWIHEQSLRASESFVEINCASLRGDLLKSELFGHAKGSFTSAVSDRQGLIEIANHGTLFLDEVGDMDMGTQAQLLKAIEDKTYRRIGESKERRSDFRLIYATNRDLMKSVRAGAFREDLYYRICVFPIVMPALKERMEDFDLLVRHLLSCMRAMPVAISGEAIDSLKKYNWPGNVRELRNMLERALILSQGGQIEASHFPGLTVIIEKSENIPLPEDLDKLEQYHISHILARYNGNTIKASRALGISRASLYRKMSNAKQTEPV